MSTDIVLPKLGLTMEEAKVVTWLKDIGDYIEPDEVILEVETDKANLEVESPGEGFLTKQHVQPDEVVEVGAVIGVLSDNESGGDDEESNDSSPENVEAHQGESVEDEPKDIEPITGNKQTRNPFIDGERIKVSPAARKLAKQEGVKLATITGTGPRGRIVLTDVKIALEKVVNTPIIDREVVPVVAGENDKVVPLSNMRKIIAKRMTNSFKNVPQFALKRGVDCTVMNTTRKALNEINSSGIKLSINDFIIQALTQALVEHSQVNTSFVDDESGSYIIEKADVNIGLAVALDDGLIVPVIHGAQNLSLLEVAQKRAELVKKAQSGKLLPEEMSGGTFTISNLGGFNVEDFTAIVNPPETGILAIGKAKHSPVFDDELNMIVKPIMQVTASFDHRTIDGAQGAKFLETIVEQLQSETWGLI